MTTPPAAPETVADLLQARAGDDAPGVLFEDHSWTWRQVVSESERRGALAARLRRPGPFHIGVLLDNLPDYLFWLGGAALAGATVVGINPTRRGEELARDIRFADCQLVVTDGGGADLLEGLDLDLPPDRVLRIESGADGPPVATGTVGVPGHPDPVDDATTGVAPSDLFLLLFTSGTTGSPKAVRCTQGRLAAIAWRAALGYGFRRDDVCYCPMPLFHGNALMALWAPATYAGASIGLTRRFSASGFLSDVRRYRATRFTYVGKALAYVLATAEHPDDRDNPLREGFGTEASGPDRAAFERRFGCRLVEGYGSSEGGAVINVTPETPTGSLGLPLPGDDIAVCSPRTKDECPPARFDGDGRLLNADEAIGEIVNRGAVASFEGYYKNAEGNAERVHGGWYWTGDLAYRDPEGFFYFAGRGDDWLRVDSENFAAAPVERIVERHPDLAAVAVYAVPDPRSGDAVMAAVELRDGARFDPDRFAAFLSEQPDLGTKWSPRFVRVMDSLPLTATGKITKAPLRLASWQCDDPVFWVPGRSPWRYRPLSEDDRVELRHEFARYGRSALLPR
ncbi:MAG TPA: AMP-binding protein [Acidimicrobiales bacterium]|nr:AMP-binding protein [Acidimicrobiales bacterium]